MVDGRSLLLVEDDETTRELLALLLEGAGWSVTAVEDGDAALASVSSSDAPVDVVLTDLQIPGLSGTALVHALREAAHPPRVLIAMTATATADKPEGFDALLVKPFAPEDVAACCASLSQRNEAATSPDDGEVIEAATLERLQKSIPADRLRGLYDFAIADAETRIERMNKAAAAGDDEQYRREAHALKGSCGMVGAIRLQRLAAMAEADGLIGLKTGSVTTVTFMEWNMFADFRGEISAIRRILERFLPG